MFEWNNKVVYIWQAQDNEFVLNLLELMAFENLTTIVTIVIKQMLNKEGFTNAQRDGRYLASNIQLTSSSINFLFLSTISLHLPSATRWRCKPRWITILEID